MDDLNMAKIAILQKDTGNYKCSNKIEKTVLFSNFTNSHKYNL